jgi:hypothetical protein
MSRYEFSRELRLTYLCIWKVTIWCGTKSCYDIVLNNSMHVISPFELLQFCTVPSGLDLSVKATKHTGVPAMLQICIVEVLGSNLICNAPS